MEDSGYCSHGPRDFQTCSTPDSAHSIFNIKYSELANSKYSYFLYGFKDEQDFEDFKQDLRDFQRLKNEFCGDVINGYDDNDLLDLKEELQFIRRPYDVCKNRRRCQANRSLSEFYKSPDLPSLSDIRSLSEPLVPADVSLSNKTCPENGKDLKSSPELTQRPLGKDSPDSFGQRADFDRRSGLFGFDRSSALRSSINNILMEFLNGDEHFQEFERVFETVNNRHNSRDLDNSLRMTSEIDNQLCVSSDSKTDNNASKDIQQPSSRYASDIFADFFDNDETFLEFEKEFEKFRSRRRSNLLESLNSIGSSRDIFADVKSYCERNIKSKSGSLVSVNSCSSQDEATPSCGDEAVHHELIWRSVEDWAKILQKMRRNSRLLLDAYHPRHHYRHSLSAQSQDGHHSDAYQRTQSLADLRRCHGSCDMNHSSLRNSPYNKRTKSSQSATDVAQRSSSSSAQNEQSSQADVMLDSSFLSVTLGNGEDNNSSSEQWSDTYDDDNRYSSSSTLCSGNGDMCCSFSSSCCSDLHFEEDTDDDLLIYSRSPPSRARRHSLMEFPSKGRPHFLGLHTSSADSLLDYNRCSGSGMFLKNSHVQGVSLRKTDNITSSNDNLPYLDDDTPTDDEDSILSGGRWSRPPSTVSAQLSDAESEHYHTATSDLSDHYSTAKSDLSDFIAERGFESKSRSLSVDLSAAPHPIPDTFQLTRKGHGFSDDHQPISEGLYHSYHGRECRPKTRYGRPRSGSACQYTCHQHCVPAVTLNCKSVSDDGFEVAAARTPSPSDPRAHLETSLSMGSIITRPGCARIVPSSGRITTNSVPAEAQRVSEFAPNLQQIVQGRSGSFDAGSSVVHPNLGREHAGTPKATHKPAHQLSRSASEGYVTANSSPVPQSTLGLSPVAHPSQGQHISSPQCSSSYSNRRPGSLQQAHIQTHTPKQPQFKSALHNAELDIVGADGSVIQGNNNDIDSDNINNNIQQLESSGDTISDLPGFDVNQDATNEKDETDSGYRSGTIPDDKLARVPSQATLDRQELSRKIAKYNHFVPAASLEVTEKESFQGFVKVTMNLIRPITMELGARPPSIYELLTREHIIEENTQQVAFYMPRDTHKSLHITSDTTTKEVVTSLLKKFHILDHPRKFAMYEQEFNDRNKLVRLHRLTDKDFPLRAVLSWDPERISNYRMVLQENETGEIVWDVFSLPELGNFLKVLDREEKETILELKHKYAYMKQYMERRLVELRSERNKQTKN